MARSTTASKFGKSAASAIPDLLMALFRAPSVLSIGFVWAAISLAILVNAPAMFGEKFATSIQMSVILYVLMIAFFAGIMRLDTPLMDISLWGFLRLYAPTFIIGSLAAAAFFHGTGFRPPSLPTGTTTNAVLIFTTFIIAVPEELVFRDWLPLLLMRRKNGQSMTSNPLAAQILSAAAFSAMHYYAYNGSITAHVFAFCAGLVFALFREGVGLNGTIQRRSTGLVMAIALHAMYDAAVFGAFFLGGSWQ